MTFKEFWSKETDIALRVTMAFCIAVVLMYVTVIVLMILGVPAP